MIYVIYSLIGGGVVLFAVLVVRSYIKKMSQGCCGAGGDGKVEKAKVGDRNRSHYPYEAKLDVDGMVCQNCAQRIENTLDGIEGVWAKANVSDKSVTVRMKTPIDDKTLKTAVNSIGGYTVMKVTR